MLVARPEQIALLAAGRPFTAPLNDGGESSSSNANSSSTSTSTQNTTNTTTTNIDKRLVATGGSGANVGVSADSTTVTVNTLDQGAVQKAFDLVAASEAGAATRFDALLAAGKSLFAEAFKVVDLNANLAKELAQPGSSALTTSTDTSTATGSVLALWASLTSQQKLIALGGVLALGGYALHKWKG